jgi:hypothetical protein
VAATGATGRGASAAGAGRALICAAYRGTRVPAVKARTVKIMAERMRQAELVHGISSDDHDQLANASRRQADFGVS